MFPAGIFGGLGYTTDEETAFRQVNRNARALAAAGDKYGAEANYNSAYALWVKMGSPTGLQDEVEYTRAILFGGQGEEGTASAPGAAQAWQEGQQNLEAAQSNQPSTLDYVAGDSFNTAGNTAGTVVFGPLWSLFAPKDAPSTIVEKAAADMRAVGIPGMDPQSGRDATTKPHAAADVLGRILAEIKKYALYIGAGAAGLILLSSYAKGRGMRANNPRRRRTYDPPRFARRGR